MSERASAPRAGTYRRPWFAPEVTQVSAMDCGVAAMACFLRGAGARANYERLREACQTDVDGTSIDTLEDVANQMGVECIQHLLPSDSFLSEARVRLPVIALITTATGYPHFIVLWSVLGERWQIMDPARGRRWLSTEELRSMLHVHTQRFSPESFRTWAESSSFFDGLCRRIRSAVDRKVADALVDAALRDPSWRGLAALDAAARFTSGIARNARRTSRAWRGKLLMRTFAQALAEADAPRTIPSSFWSVLPAHRGGVVTVSGPVMLASRSASPPAWSPQRAALDDAVYLQRVLSEPEPSLLSIARPLLRRTMWPLVGASVAVALVSVFIALLEVLAMRVALSDLPQLAHFSHKLGAVGWLVSLFFLLFSLEAWLAFGQRKIGRALEVRLRLALFGALPSLEENFIRSRPTSDLAQRAQLLHFIRDIPTVGLTVLRGAADLVCTLLVIGLLDPGLSVVVVVAAAVLALIGIYTGKRSAEIERKLQTHGAALLHVFQDALLGVVPLRVHGAEAALRREHRSRLLPWFAAQNERLSQATFALSFQGIAMAVLLVLTLLRGQSVFPDGSRLVLLLFWVLRVPLASQALIGALQSFPAYRLALERALEPVRGSHKRFDDDDDERTTYGLPNRGVRLRLANVQVVAAGLVVLRPLSLTITSGEHVAIVGRSGAGKSTLLSLLLGLRAPSQGRIFVDERPLEGDTLHALRRQTAWIDPNVQLWNESFLANLMYGQDGVFRSMNSVLELSDLVGVVERLPEGLMTRIGSDGTLLSGGEGQRLRVGRALLNQRPRLALLDEPFRGLGRDLRKRMLDDLREVFCRETIIVVTHDVEHIVGMDRVLVVEDGEVVEDGPPSELLQSASRFRELYEADLRNKEAVWNDAGWIHMEIAGGVAALAADPRDALDGEAARPEDRAQ